MARTFLPARFPSGEAPSVLDVPYTAGQTFTKGALLVYTGAGTVSECGANPAKVAGVAGAAAGTEYGASAANNPTIITGQNKEVPMLVADRVTVFSARGVNGATDPVVPTDANRHVSYGVSKVGSDWVVNIADTTNLVVKVVDIDIPNNVFFVKFLDAVIDLV